MAATKYEVVAITRCGLNFLASERLDMAAKVTYHRYTPGQIFDPRKDVIAELFIPLANPRQWD